MNALDKLVLARTPEGLIFEVNRGEAYLWQEATGAIRAYQGPLDIVLDIGGHVGCFALYAAYKGAKHILSFEPSPQNYFKLTRNLIRNGFMGRISPFPMAVSTSDGERLPLYKAGTNDGQFSLKFRSEYPSQSVETVSFKTILKSFEKVDYLKIDIEGGEFDLFDGSDELQELLQKVGFIDVELHPPTNEKYYSPDDFGKKHSFFSSPENAEKELSDYLVSCGFKDATPFGNENSGWLRSFHEGVDPSLLERFDPSQTYSSSQDYLKSNRDYES